MAVQDYTDLFNTTLDNLAATLAEVTGLTVVQDPRNINPPCVFIDAPTFEAWNSKIATMNFPVRVISLGPNNLDAQRQLLNLASKLLDANVAVMDGRPTIAVIGSSDYPAYDLTIPIQATT